MIQRRSRVRVLVAAVAVAFLSAAVTLPLVADGAACDAAKTGKGKYCPQDKIVLEKGSTLGEGATYECGECGKKARKEGNCEKCKTALGKSGAEKGACTQCGTMGEDVTVCVKTYHECPECGSKQNKGGKCAGCKKALKKMTSSALVEFTCQGCGAVARTKGKCTAEDCSERGKPLAKRCTASGTFPHVSVPKSEKPKKEKKPKEKKPKKTKKKKK